MRLDQDRGKKSEWYSKYFEKEVGLSPEDQRWIWENVPHIDSREKEIRKTNVSVNGNVNDTYKNGVNTELTLSKRNVINDLKGCTYRTSPKRVASLLAEFFAGWGTKKGHWLYVAQHWTPRAINRVLTIIIKQYERGDKTVDNPAAYFTHLIKFRKERRYLVNTNDTCKQI